MGLDQYLYAKKYFYISKAVSSDTERQTGTQIANLAAIPVHRDGVGVKVDVEIGYWRKANAIHHWMVENVQNGTDDCGEYYISREQLAVLRDTVQRVIDDPESADELLPTASGFFFGSTEYDEWYAKDLARTIEIIDRALALPEDIAFEYSSSW